MIRLQSKINKSWNHIALCSQSSLKNVKLAFVIQMQAVLFSLPNIESNRNLEVSLSIHYNRIWGERLDEWEVKLLLYSHLVNLSTNLLLWISTTACLWLAKTNLHKAFWHTYIRSATYILLLLWQSTVGVTLYAWMLHLPALLDYGIRSLSINAYLHILKQTWVAAENKDEQVHTICCDADILCDTVNSEVWSGCLLAVHMATTWRYFALAHIRCVMLHG